MNEVRISGKVLAAYEKNSVFVVRLAVRHEHVIGRERINVESIFTAVMSDAAKIPHIDVQQGDKVLITGHLKQDFKKSPSGTEHQKMTLYADDIEVTEYAK